MDQNQVAGSDNDLQKAIDNITNQSNTSNSAFSDPVAASPSIPEGDTGELADPIGPFPMPDTDSKVDIITQGPEPIAPIEPISLPDLKVSGEDMADATVVPKPNPDPSDQMAPIASNVNVPEPSNAPSDNNAPAPMENNFNQPAPEQHDAPTQRTDMPPMPNPNPAQDNSFMNSAPADSPSFDTNSSFNNMPPSTSENMGNSNTLEIKKAILKDLAPLLERTNADASQKFKIYRDTIEDLHDYSVLDNAYQAASNIQNEDERADSLLYLLESIDSM